MNTKQIAVEWRDVPATLRAALEACGQAGGTVRVRVGSQWERGIAGTGCRAVACAVNLVTGETRTEHGAWGGDNPFAVVPLDHAKGDACRIPEGFAVVSGTTGYRTFVHVYVRPENVAGMLPADVALTLSECICLAVLKCYNSRGRADHWGRHPMPEREEAMRALAARGLVKISSNGAAQITAAGRNALASGHAPHAADLRKVDLWNVSL